jgi:hypothetical protein
MPKPRKLWSALKPATQKRKLAFYRKRGLSEAAIKARYNSGSLGSQSAVRGHSATPERPSRAAKHPGRYQKYIEKRRRIGDRFPPVSRRDLAEGNVERQIGHYIKYSPAAVHKRIHYMMTDNEVEWTIHASEDMIVGRAAANYGMRLFGDYRQSPWWYHKD